MSADSPSEPPTWPLVTAPGSDAGPTRLARLSGVLVGFVADGFAWMWLAAPDGSLTPVAWPLGYRGRFDPLELLDAEGRCVARGGDVVRTAGGYTGAGVPHLAAFERMGVSGVFTAGGRPVVVTRGGISADRGL